MNPPNNGRSGKERDWLEYTHRTYWAFLNCGFKIQPTAGTANGVHPVPLGFSRVYVHLPEGFTYQGWLKGLQQGRSFVTTGPMIFAEYGENEVSGSVISEGKIDEVEVILNGEISAVVALQPRRNEDGAWEAEFRHPLKLLTTSWVAIRCWEKKPSERERFAHTAPKWFEVENKPLAPKKHEVNYLLSRVKDEIQRSKGILPASAILEYEKAERVYEDLLKSAK